VNLVIAIPAGAQTTAVATTMTAAAIAGMTARVITQTVAGTTAGDVPILIADPRATARDQRVEVMTAMVARIAETAPFWIIPSR